DGDAIRVEEFMIDHDVLDDDVGRYQRVALLDLGALCIEQSVGRDAAGACDVLYRGASQQFVAESVVVLVDALACIGQRYDLVLPVAQVAVVQIPQLLGGDQSGYDEHDGDSELRYDENPANRSASAARRVTFNDQRGLECGEY